MKLLDGERPTLRNWLVFWGVGFVSICLVGTLLCVALWLIGLAAQALGPPHSAVAEFSLPTSLRIVPLAAAGFGVFLATVMISQWRRDGRIHRACVPIPGYHAIIGPYEYIPYSNQWRAKLWLPGDHPVALLGFGPEPSESQAALWSRFHQRRCSLGYNGFFHGSYGPVGCGLS